MLLTTATPAIASAFTASIVEAVEAFTIVLAVGTLQGWKPALFGTGTALIVLGLLILILGPLLNLIPLHALQFVIGILRLIFGMGWLRKAKDQVTYIPELKSWFCYDPKTHLWRQDNDGQIVRCAKTLPTMLRKEAKKADNIEKKKQC